VCDFKFGQIEIGANSTQNLFYIAAALRSFPPFRDVETFDSYLIQPAFDPVIVHKLYTRREVESAQIEFDTAIYLNERAPPRYVEGEHCAWCPAAVRCPAKTQRLTSLVAASRPQDIAAMADYWKSFQTVWDVANDIKAQLIHELEHGVPVPGFKLVARRTEDQWKDDGLAYLRLTAAGYSIQQIMRLRPPADLANIVPADALEPLIHRPPGGSTIAPEGDRRPAVVPAAALGAALRRLNRR
jgi:hypothetical protein